MSTAGSQPSGEASPTIPLAPRPPEQPEQASAPQSRRDPHRPGAGLRALELAAGLASGGMAAAGVALVALELLAPHIIDGASGPGWGVALAHLGVGVCGEVLRANRFRVSAVVRTFAAAAVLAIALAVIAGCWWGLGS